MQRLNLPTAINLMRWLVWDTFRQAIASRIFGVMLTVSIVAMLFCASVGVRGGKLDRSTDEPAEFLPKGVDVDPEKAQRDGIQVIEGELTLAFGAIRVEHARDAQDSIHYLQLILASGVAGTLGVLLTLIWSAGFLPSFLEPASASVLLTKPVPRWLLLLGKYIGMVIFVGFQATIFVGGTWLTLGISTGVWTHAYLLAVPLLMIQFAFFYSFSMFLAVATRSTVVCIIGSVLFWLLCTAVNSARIELLLNPESPTLLRWLAEAGYWILPKPVDFNLILGHALNAGHHFAPWPALKAFEEQGRAAPDLALVTSLLFAGIMILVSAFDVGKVDY